MQDLLRYNFDQKYLVADFETEALNLIRTKPYELSWLVCKGKKTLDKQQRYIFWEDLAVSKGAAAINGFDNAFFEKTGRKKRQYKIRGRVVTAEDPAFVLREFESYVYDPEYRIVGQNWLGYDIYIHNVVRKLLGLPTDHSYVGRVLDTKALSAAYKKGTPVDKNNFLFWQYRLLNYHKKGFKTSQSVMLKELEIEHDPDKLHDGLYDIEQTFQLLWKLLFFLEI